MNFISQWKDRASRNGSSRDLWHHLDDKWNPTTTGLSKCVWRVEQVRDFPMGGWVIPFWAWKLLAIGATTGKNLPILVENAKNLVWEIPVYSSSSSKDCKKLGSKPHSAMKIIRWTQASHRLFQPNLPHGAVVRISKSYGLSSREQVINSWNFAPESYPNDRYLVI